MRIYIPATLPRLREIVEAGGLPPGFLAYAVTPALREWYTDGDVEELEYVDRRRTGFAMPAGRRPGGRRSGWSCGCPDTALVHQPDGRGLAAVVTVSPQPDPAPLCLGSCRQRHAVDDVRVALGAVPDADGDGDAQFLLDSVEDHELL
jgi:hypothetical protein